MLLECEDTESKRTKTSNFLKGLKNDKQAKQGKRADSSGDKADWSAVGSGLLIMQKGSREIEPEKIKQLNFTNMFGNEHASTAEPAKKMLSSTECF